MVEKSWITGNGGAVIMSHNANLSEKEKSDSAPAQCLKSSEETVTESSSTSFQVGSVVDHLFASLFSNASWYYMGWNFFFSPNLTLLLHGLANRMLRYGYEYWQETRTGDTIRICTNKIHDIEMDMGILSKHEFSYFILRLLYKLLIFYKIFQNFWKYHCLHSFRTCFTL